MSYRTIYKYDKLNRIISQVCYSLDWGCKYNYKSKFRKVYYFHKKINTTQISKETLVDNKYQLISSLVDFAKARVYTQYTNNKESYTKVITKGSNIVENRVLLDVGQSSIKETTITSKDGKKQKHLKIITKQHGAGE